MNVSVCVQCEQLHAAVAVFFNSRITVQVLGRIMQLSAQMFSHACESMTFECVDLFFLTLECWHACVHVSDSNLNWLFAGFLFQCLLCVSANISVILNMCKMYIFVCLCVLICNCARICT